MNSALNNVVNHVRQIVTGINVRALAAGAGDALTIADWFATCAPYDFRCVRCGVYETVEIDHIVPLADGGTNTLGNVQPLCHSCNCSKGARHHTDYRPAPFQHVPIDGMEYLREKRAKEWALLLPSLHAAAESPELLDAAPSPVSYEDRRGTNHWIHQPNAIKVNGRWRKR